MSIWKQLLHNLTQLLFKIFQQNLSTKVCPLLPLQHLNQVLHNPYTHHVLTVGALPPSAPQPKTSTVATLACHAVTLTTLAEHHGKLHLPPPTHNKFLKATCQFKKCKFNTWTFSNFFPNFIDAPTHITI